MLTEKEGFLVKNIEFCSAGGFAGSLQYYIEDAFGKKVNLIKNLPAILLLYPIEWFLDKLSLGDVFSLKVTKM